ncbi:MAG: class I tRNA ligase family protein, partial [Lactobacillaceae bacterium]
YSDVNWKKKVKKCFDAMECDADTRAKLNEGVDWINKWGFSRSFGLGTRIPWDEQYLIDSLSDSDIYMAFYTFNHNLFKDLEGSIEIFPSSDLCNEVWDYIFGFSPLNEKLQKHENILNKCKKDFEYFYPVDLRVSGKDLIKNHLLFFVFNHVAIFDEKYWPKRIYTNGHLMLNSEKMSKSTGNFMTVDDVFEKYGVSATRMCLAVAGDTNEDANFVESNSNMFILKLYTLCKNIDSRPNIQKKIKNQDIISLTEKNPVDQLFIELISKNIMNTINSYELMKYGDVMKYGFFEILHDLALYNSLKGDNEDIINFTYKVIVQLMYPIVPDLCRNLLKKYFNDEFALPKPIVETSKNIL